MTDEVPASAVKERYAALVERVNQIAWEENQRFEGRQVEVLVAEGEGRKDSATHRLSGRARDNRLVHVTPGVEPIRPGDLVVAEVTHAAPHHLLSDRPALSVRRTRAGDAWAARQGGADSEARPTVGLGMPTLGPPAVEEPVRSRC